MPGLEVANYQAMKLKVPDFIESLHKSRRECLQRILQGMIAGLCVQIPKIARFLGGPHRQEAAYKRVARFLGEAQMDKVQIARFVCLRLKLNRISKWTLVIDRTNWKYGKHHRNFLVLGVLFKGHCIPLISTNLGDKRKCGNSNRSDRAEVLRIFREAFPCQKVNVLLADREFLGEGWFSDLDALSIGYVVRLKEGWHVINDRANQRTLPIGTYVEKQLKGHKKILNNHRVLLGASKPEVAFITAFKVGKELFVLRHSEGVKQAHRQYKRRWKIETCFKNLKSAGVDLESTHLLNPIRLENICCIALIAMALVYAQGPLVQEKVKHHGSPQHSLFRRCLDHLHWLITHCYYLFEELMAFKPPCLAGLHKNVR